MTPLRVPATLGSTSVRELLQGLQQADPGGLVALSGEPGCFCRGMDLEEGPRALREFEALLEAISERICVAVVDGEASGGGVGIAACCDLVIVTPRARFSLPEALIGLLPAIVTPSVARRTGPAAALALSLGLVALDAEAALRCGLADLLADDPLPALEAAARRLACADRRAIAAIKRLHRAHYAPAAGWGPDAAREFDTLSRSPETDARLQAMALGEAPWLAEGA